VYVTHRRAAHGLSVLTLTFRLALARAAAVRTRVAGVASLPENLMFSIVVGYGVGTLFATGLLFVMQLLEDFRDA